MARANKPVSFDITYYQASTGQDQRLKEYRYKQDMKVQCIGQESAHQNLEEEMKSVQTSREEKICRICFSSDMNEQTQRLLEKPCACKGSLSFVHESCLVKWLLQKNIRKCELCNSSFIVNEETGSISEVVRHAVSQLFKTRRRVFKAAVYSVYIILFLRRFHLAVRYFAKALHKSMKKQMDFVLLIWGLTKDFTDKLMAAPKSIFGVLKVCLKYYFKVVLAVFGLLEATEKGELPQVPSKKKVVYFLFKKLINAITLSYNFFVMTQLIFIGAAEKDRLHQLFRRVINQTKKLRVIDNPGGAEDQLEFQQYLQRYQNIPAMIEDPDYRLPLIADELAMRELQAPNHEQE